MYITKNKEKGVKSLKLSYTDVATGAINQEFIVLEDINEDKKVVDYVAYMLENSITNCIFIKQNYYFFIKLEQQQKDETQEEEIVVEDKILVIYAIYEFERKDEALIEADNFFLGKSPTFINVNEVKIKKIIDYEEITKKAISVILLIIVLVGMGIGGWYAYKKLTYKPPPKKTVITIPPLDPEETKVIKYFLLKETIHDIIGESSRVMSTDGDGIMIKSVSVTVSDVPSTGEGIQPAVKSDIAYTYNYTYPEVGSVRESEKGLFKYSKSKTITKDRIFLNEGNKMMVYKQLSACNIKKLYDLGFNLLERQKDFIKYNLNQEAIIALKAINSLYADNCKFSIEGISITGGKLNADITVYTQ